jgi:hypothetical protein
MKISILFGVRNERYEGENAPEALLVWDEFSIEENPSGFDSAVKTIVEGSKEEFQATRVIQLDVNQNVIRALVLSKPTLKAKVVG